MRQKNHAKNKKASDSQKKLLLFKQKTREKFSHLTSRFDRITKAAIGKQRQKFDPRVEESRWGGLAGGNVLLRTGKAIPGWRKN